MIPSIPVPTMVWALPWAELLPDYTPAAAGVVFVLSFWYGYRHPPSG